MDYRIIEVKEPGKRSLFYPMYRTFLCWHNVNEDYSFIRKDFDSCKQLSSSAYTLSIYAAVEILKDFKKHRESKPKKIVHKIKI